MSRRHAPATERNREPILEVLRAWLPPRGQVVEIACGTGQHAAFFAPRFPGLVWQPTDPDPEARASADEWTANLDNVCPALELDASSNLWPVGEADAIFCANMIHISPIEACTGVLAGAARILRLGGCLVLYGPYRVGGRHTAPSNESFDEDLRARDPAWGIRDLEFVIETAAAAGLAHQATVPMPANNLCVVFRASGVGPAWNDRELS